MTLQEQLSKLKNQNLSFISEEVKRVMFNENELLKESFLLDSIPQPGDKLDDFNLINPLGKNRSLEDIRKKGPVIITFYRGGWCPYCNLELAAYQRILPDIVALGGTLVAITPELPDSSLTTSEKNGLEFEVLTDKNCNYAKQIGLSFTLPDSLKRVYREMDLDLKKHNGEDLYELPIPVTYLIDSNGYILYSFADTDYTVRANPADVLRALRNHLVQE